MSNELERHHGGGEDLALEMRYADVLSQSDLVPVSYRRKPANILIAMGLGAAMGLSRTESLYRIDVIQGKPTAAAELIASNVRRAGHQIRTVVNAEDMWVETTITRRDDPSNPVTVRRDMGWARAMGLAEKDNYRKQPLTMLQWRSITACARLACSEALYGVQYTADELRESSPSDKGSAAPAVTAATFAAAVPTEPVEVDGEAVADHAAEPTPRTDEQAARLTELFELAGITDQAGQRQYIAEVLPSRADKRRGLSAVEADEVLACLDADLAGEDRPVDGEVVDEGGAS